jgi:hypothetical protein
MSTAVTVSHGFPTTATTVDGSIGISNDQDSVAMSHTFTSTPGHEYLVTVFISALWRTTSGEGRQYQLEVAGTVLTSAWQATTRGGWVGLMSSPTCLSGSWTETSAASRVVTVNVNVHKELAGDQDWRGDEGLHTLRIIDMGRP